MSDFCLQVIQNINKGEHNYKILTEPVCVLEQGVHAEQRDRISYCTVSGFQETKVGRWNLQQIEEL